MPRKIKKIKLFMVCCEDHTMYIFTIAFKLQPVGQKRKKTYEFLQHGQ